MKKRTSKNKRKVAGPRAALVKPKRKRAKRESRRGLFSAGELEALHRSFVITAIGMEIARFIGRLIPSSPGINFLRPENARELIDYTDPREDVNVIAAESDDILDAEYIGE